MLFYNKYRIIIISENIKNIWHNFRDVKKYRVVDEDHPNEKVWDEIVPALVKELNL